ncbi:hypothetical protein [uncultured Actinomyces sp.]|uniref:hypothetical protein n=1 Tax=uncultured Actinomyces sp. TaxID=249061 RepID=UPI00260BB41F|nr:hypothetical protein [uncultured Actinomyces sp.]
MDPIERVSDAVAALVGRDMTLEDAHQFILEAAQMMEPVKPIIIGGSEQEETHIRWRTPDRSLRLSVRGTTIHSSFGDTRLIENDEYYNLESEEPEYKPYRWMIALGPEIQEIDIRSKPCTMCSCWDQFDAEFDRSMSDLVDGLGMMPPQWRPQIRYQWDLRVSGLGVLTASVSADGVELASDATGQTVLLPPGFPLGFGRVLAGLAGGARLRDVPMLASGGLAVTPLSPNGSESPEEIEEFDWFEEENEQGYAPDSQENRRPALTFAQLRDLAAQVASPEPSAGSRDEVETFLCAPAWPSVRCAASWTSGRGACPCVTFLSPMGALRGSLTAAMSPWSATAGSRRRRRRGESGCSPFRRLPLARALSRARGRLPPGSYVRR